jgi:Mor family transcriptional regulator
MPNLELFNPLSCDPMDLIERAGDALTDRSRWPARLQELFDIEYRYSLRSLGADAAAQDAGARTFLIADYVGGSALYVPRGESLRLAVRNAEIYARYRGPANHAALAREYGVTEPHLYEIVAAEKKRQVSKRQGRLFQE